MQKTTTVCDVCGKVKGESNHWWELGIDPLPSSRQFGLCPADAEGKHNGWDQLLDLCGQECAVVKLSEFMNPPKPQSQQAQPIPILCEKLGCGKPNGHSGDHDYGVKYIKGLNLGL